MTTLSPSLEREHAIAGATRSVTRKRFGSLLKVVRRVHMYLGLLLFPWILLFGISGMLFNHPTLGRSIAEQTLAPEKLASLTGFRAWNPELISTELVEQLNRESGQRFELDAGFRARFFGWPLFVAPSADGGRYVLIANLEDGGATLSKHAAATPPATSPFQDTRIELPDYRMAALGKQMKDLLPKLGESASKSLNPHPKVAPELRFRVRDTHQQVWNVRYNLGDGSFTGKPVNASSLGLSELLGELHKTHHYPVHSGASFWWALFADLTGITLVIWALTGLFMWWKMKPTRVLGVAAVSVALAISAICTLATAREIEFAGAEAGGP
jgi:hypothetical protein